MAPIDVNIVDMESTIEDIDNIEDIEDDENIGDIDNIEDIDNIGDINNIDNIGDIESGNINDTVEEIEEIEENFICPLCRQTSVKYLLEKKYSAENNDIKEESSSDDEKKCVVCFDKKRNVTYEACKHKCVCIDCLEKINDVANSKNNLQRMIERSAENLARIRNNLTVNEESEGQNRLGNNLFLNYIDIMSPRQKSLCAKICIFIIMLIALTIMMVNTLFVKTNPDVQILIFACSSIIISLLMYCCAKVIN